MYRSACWIQQLLFNFLQFLRKVYIHYRSDTDSFWDDWNKITFIHENGDQNNYYRVAEESNNEAVTRDGEGSRDRAVLVDVTESTNINEDSKHCSNSLCNWFRYQFCYCKKCFKLKGNEVLIQCGPVPC